jgi:hypothetical protein
MRGVWLRFEPLSADEDVPGLDTHKPEMTARRPRIVSEAGADLGFVHCVHDQQRAEATFLGLGERACEEDEPPVKSELLLRLLVADLVGVAATRRSIRALRAEIAELQELISASEASAEALPHRRRYLLLVDEYLWGLLDLQLELIEKV